MRELRRCIKACIKRHSPHAGMFTYAAIIACSLPSVLAGDFTMSTLLPCLAYTIGGTATATLTACVQGCFLNWR